MSQMLTLSPLSTAALLVLRSVANRRLGTKWLWPPIVKVFPTSARDRSRNSSRSYLEKKETPFTGRQLFEELWSASRPGATKKYPFRLRATPAHGWAENSLEESIVLQPLPNNIRCHDFGRRVFRGLSHRRNSSRRRSATRPACISI
jgi:hypothetical protein